MTVYPLTQAEIVADLQAQRAEAAELHRKWTEDADLYRQYAAKEARRVAILDRAIEAARTA